MRGDPLIAVREVSAYRGPRWRVVVSAPYARPCIDRYRRVLEQAGCDVEFACATERLDEEAPTLLPGAHGIICGDDRITARVLDGAPDSA